MLNVVVPVVARRLAAVVLATTTVSLAGWVSAASFDLVTVGDLGNAADTNSVGRVAYGYQIGKYEVTIGQYAEFLNAVAQADPYGLWNPLMGSDLNVAGIARSGTSGAYTYSIVGGGTGSHRPISYVSWFDAARYVNWLSTGTTETGAYLLNGGTSGTAPARVSGFAYVLPNEHEWYKAAYYSGSGSYWAYATQSDSPPSNDVSRVYGNTANVMVNGLYAVTQSPIRDPTQNYLMDVGASGTSSHYGTFDQTGNVAEWLGVGASTSQSLRGGSWKDDVLQVSSRAQGARITASGTVERATYGFRIVNLWGGTSSAPSPSPPSTDVIVIHVPRSKQRLVDVLPAGRSMPSGQVCLLKTGTGVCAIDQVTAHTGATIIQAGKVELVAGGSLAGTLVEPLAGGTFTLSGSLTASVGGLAPNAGGLADIADGSLTVTAGLAVSDLMTALMSGRGDGTWNGTSGITSSHARTSIASSVPRTVGWLDNGDASVTVAFVAPGDTNLDWTIDILDASNLIAAGKFDASANATWTEGELNYDGIVDILDAVEFLKADLFDAGPYHGAAGNAVSVSAVPEPAVGLAGAAVVLSIAGLSRRRRVAFHPAGQ